MTERLVVGEAWRQCWVDASRPYLGTAATVEDLIHETRVGPRPTLVVLIDAELVAPATSLQLRSQGARIVLLTPMALTLTCRRVLRSGVDAMITLGDSLVTMRAAVEGLAASAHYASPLAAGLLFDEVHRRSDERSQASDVELSGREQEVLRAMVDGLTTKSTAQRLGISLKTVEAHRSRLFVRLRVRTQSQAVALALADERLLGRTQGSRSRLPGTTPSQ